MEQDFLQFLVMRGVLTSKQRDDIRQSVRCSREPLGGIAFAHGLLSADDIDLVLSQQREEHRPFGQIATELGILTPAQVETLVQVQHARLALSLAEAISLAGIVPLGVALAELGAFLGEAPVKKAA